MFGESDTDRASSTISGLKIPLKRPPGTSQCRSIKRDRKAIQLRVKLEVLRRFEAGEKKLSRIGKALGPSTSTVAAIHDKEKIRASSQAGAAQVATRWTRSRSLVMENMEGMLSVWIADQRQRNVPINVTLIQEKARSLFEDLK